MPFEITMPQLGLTMETGSVVEWLVQEGDPFSAGQEIFTVETDKSVVAVEARHDGNLARILVPAGHEVPVGTVLAAGVTAGETLPAGWQPSQVTKAGAAKAEPVPEVTPAPASAPTGGSIQASWKARNMARQAGLALQLIEGSGPGRRILAADVSAALAARTAVPTEPVNATPVAANLATALGLDLAQVQGSGPQGRITQADVLETAAALIRNGPAAPARPRPGLPRVVTTTPLSGVRKIVSEGMAASAHTAARVTLFREVDVATLVRLRKTYQAQGLDVTYNDLLIQICAVALREHPQANARLGPGQIEYLDRINIGLAVDTARGLLVPVIHHADRLTLAHIVADRVRLIEAARAGRSVPDDLSGGTFTITNLGMLGVDGFTPIINLPECCILGVGRIVRKPVATENDAVLVRPTMNLSLVFDHRVIDGAPAAHFLDRIAQLVEDPMLLLTIDDSH